MTKKKKTKKAKKKTTVKKTKKPTPPVQTVPMPNAGPAVKEFEDQLDQTINESPPPPHGGKRTGAGRPPKQEPIPDVDFISSEMSVVISEVLRSPFDLWAAKTKNDAMALTDTEARLWSESTAKLLNLFLPNVDEKQIAIIWFSMTTIAIFRPRMVMTWRAAQSAPAAAADRTPPAEPSAAPVDSKNFGFPSVDQVKPVNVDG